MKETAGMVSTKPMAARLVALGLWVVLGTQGNSALAAEAAAPEPTFVVGVVEPVAGYRLVTIDADDPLIGTEKVGGYSEGPVAPPTLELSVRPRRSLELGLSWSGGAAQSKSNLALVAERSAYVQGLVTVSVIPWRSAWGYPKIGIGVGYYHSNGAWSDDNGYDGYLKANAVAASANARFHFALFPHVGLNSGFDFCGAKGKGRLKLDNDSIPVDFLRLGASMTLGLTLEF